MSLQIGIVGLPNAGKSTLFNALTESSKAAAENFPFCTIEPNSGLVPIKDQRLEQIAQIANAAKVIPETIEFVDIAGLVEGASKGEGLGNKFLSHIRQTNSILLVLRFFEEKEVIHHLGAKNPKRDKEILETELILKDLQTLEKSLEKIKKEAKSGDKEKIKQVELLENIKQNLNSGKKISSLNLNQEEQAKIANLHLLTAKKFIFAANLSENELVNFNEKAARQEIGLLDNEVLIPISAKIEAEIALLEKEEKEEFLKALNLKQSGLEKLVLAAKEALNLANFFTAGEKETRAWTIVKNSTAPQAAGKIHTDFEKGFIKADSVSWQDFIKFNGWSGCREKGLVQIVGKDHLVKDGEVLFFKFSS